MKLGGMDKLKYYVCQADRLIAPGIDNLLKNGSIHECLHEYEYDPNKLHTTEILVADIAFVFLFHTRQSNRNNAIGRDALPNWGNHRYWMVRENAS
jgi:hypothetical protein